MYYARGRGELAWVPDSQQMLDTQSGTGGTVPHVSQITWAFAADPRALVVDGVSYRIGFGDPGQDSDGACANNCLIDSLRQCLGLVADCTLVRRDLIAQYSNAVGRARATINSYLDVESHWAAIVKSLFVRNTSGELTTCNVDFYCVIALSHEREGHGSVEGSRAANWKLVVMNYNDVHFDPCLQA